MLFPLLIILYQIFPKDIKELIPNDLVCADFSESEGNYYLKNEAGQLIEMLIEDVKH